MSLLFFVSELAKHEYSTAINEGKIKCGLSCKSYTVQLDRATAGKISFFKRSRFSFIIIKYVTLLAL